MYQLEINPQTNKKFLKLKNKNPKQLRIISKKLEQVLKNPFHFKPLKGDMHGTRKVHTNNSFVLIYSIKNKTITILDYAHHDKIY